jgi:hypothetical protein
MISLLASLMVSINSQPTLNLAAVALVNLSLHKNRANHNHNLNYRKEMMTLILISVTLLSPSHSNKNRPFSNRSLRLNNRKMQEEIFSISLEDQMEICPHSPKLTQARMHWISSMILTLELLKLKAISAQPLSK